MLIFDIETGPIPDEQLREMLPPFDPAEVKLGNLKDETKIAAKLKEAEANHWTDFVARAALSPLTGRVLAIGFRGTDTGKSSIIGAEGGEPELLCEFWKKTNSCWAARRTMAGWNIHGFDLPFLIRRSWLHGVEMPANVRVAGERYWNDMFVDLMQRFAVGEWKAHVKLDVAARFFGCGSKPADVTGADFARLWLGTAEERQQAVAYLKNDLEMTAGVASRLGVV